jgi:hypothetical protein
MLIEQIHSLTTPAKDALLGLYAELSEAIWIPNSVLPRSEHGHKAYEMDGTASAGKIYGRVAADLLKEAPEKQPTLEELDKIEKEKRIPEYDGTNIQYIEDEERLYRSQVTFCKIMLENGVLHVDDFME